MPIRVKQMYVIVDPSRSDGHWACFWRPRSMGYTFDPDEAGKYDEEEAREITARVEDYAVLADTVAAKTVKRVHAFLLPRVDFETSSEGR